MMSLLSPSCGTDVDRQFVPRKEEDRWKAGQSRFGTAEFGKFSGGMAEVQMEDTRHCSSSSRSNTVVQ